MTKLMYCCMHQSLTALFSLFQLLIASVLVQSMQQHSMDKFCYKLLKRLHVPVMAFQVSKTILKTIIFQSTSLIQHGQKPQKTLTCTSLILEQLQQSTQTDTHTQTHYRIPYNYGQFRVVPCRSEFKNLSIKKKSFRS